MAKPTSNIENAAQQVERAFREISGAAVGSGFTLQPGATRENVVAMTQTHGLCHLFEFADGLSQLRDSAPELYAELVACRNVVDLNSGAGLSGVLVAMLSATEDSVPQIVFIDHAKAAVEFAVRLAARLSIKASGLVVEKQFVGAPEYELPDHRGTLTSAVLSPPLQQLVGRTTIVAGHALSCHALNRDSKRQQNLTSQNKLVLAQVDQALDLTAGLVLVDLDIAFHGLKMRDFVSMVCTSDNASQSRAATAGFEAWPENRTPGKQGKVKYFAAQQLDAIPSVESLVAWQVGDFEILLSGSEFDALIGESASRYKHPGLQQLLAQEVL